MSAKATKPIDFNHKLQQLNELLAWFESDDLQIELATEKYQQAKQVIDELQAQLNTTEQQIEVIRQTQL